ncbi:unnamed protein product [Lepeophtheirus salmonis]|uniref:(salmon louse) hypothetical protein n=1 Tax=Lepeophtheirus salmonis TaxID=72036 RepID=A0A817FAE3_LEPSM|nr:unnamed protein product [Lepeophtheirus salmonis]CAG9476391.1 unnamed protein product [Lepeophtheirus salmonis]
MEEETIHSTPIMKMNIPIDEYSINLELLEEEIAVFKELNPFTHWPQGGLSGVSSISAGQVLVLLGLGSVEVGLGVAYKGPKDKRLFYNMDGHCNVDKSPYKVLDSDATFKYEGILLNSKEICKPDSIKILSIYLDCIGDALVPIVIKFDFIQDISTVAASLHKLTKSLVEFSCANEVEESFSTIKKKIVKSPCLIQFDQMLSLVLTTDASHLGIRSRSLPNGFASRKLTSAEHNHTQIDKEATGIIYCLNKFERRFIRLPEIVSAHIARYAMRLSMLNYKIDYIKGSENSQAD